MIPVTCAIVDGLLQVVVIGDYDFEEVKRAISAAVDHVESDSVRAMVYDVRSAIGQPFANEVRIGAGWIGGLSARGLRARPVVGRHGASRSAPHSRPRPARA